MLDVHLKVCASCQEDIRSFLAIREQIDKETDSSFVPVTPDLAPEQLSWLTWWRGLAWKPAYAAAAVILIAIAIGVAAVVMKRRAANLEANRTPLENSSPVTVQTPTPESRAAGNNPAPPAPVPSNVPPIPNPSPALTVKNRTPAGTPENKSTAITLKDDRGRTVTIDQAGTVSGLDDVASTTRDEVAKALTEKLEAPEILAKLSGPDIILRGPNSGQPFKLLSPARAVVISNHPLFQWEKLPGATSYRVYVGDLNGHEVAKSEELSPDRTTWTPPASLERGEIYSWAVAAVVDGKEVLSPGAAAPEMKFQVLSLNSLQQLNQLRKRRSHLALGVFYMRVGMIVEAQQEFQELSRLNPKSRVSAGLLSRAVAFRRRL